MLSLPARAGQRFEDQYDRLEDLSGASARARTSSLAGRVLPTRGRVGQGERQRDSQPARDDRRGHGRSVQPLGSAPAQRAAAGRSCFSAPRASVLGIMLRKFDIATGSLVKLIGGRWTIKAWDLKP